MNKCPNCGFCLDPWRVKIVNQIYGTVVYFVEQFDGGRSTGKLAGGLKGWKTEVEAQAAADALNVFARPTT